MALQASVYLYVRMSEITKSIHDYILPTKQNMIWKHMYIIPPPFGWWDNSAYAIIFADDSAVHREIHDIVNDCDAGMLQRGLHTLSN